MSGFEGQVAVVTGGETGIGLATVRLFAEAGMRVVIGGILDDQGRAAADGFRGLGQHVSYEHADVRDVANVDALVDGAVREHGRVDVLVNNAAVFDGFASCLDTSDALWDKVVDINLRGCFYGCRAALRHMVPAGRGKIINVSSIGGVRGGADGTSYTASKFGIIGLTKQLACDYAAKGVSVNAVCPGVTQTDVRANSTRILGSDAPAMRGVGVDPDFIPRTVPAGRKGLPEDVANAIMFLASDKAGYIHGQSILVDGGWSAK